MLLRQIIKSELLECNSVMFLILVIKLKNTSAFISKNISNHENKLRF